MKPIILLKQIDIHMGQFILEHLPKKIPRAKNRTLLLTFCPGSLGSVEDRVRVYFDLLSQTESSQRIFYKKLIVRKFLPSFYFAVLVFIYHLKYKISFLLIDYNTASRVPTLNTLGKLNAHLKMCFVWFESFEQENTLRRIKPCLLNNSLHIITDDPQLRILGNPEFQLNSDFFRFFPAPFFPAKYFRHNAFESKKFEISFFGAVDDSVGHRERLYFLDRLSTKWPVHGFRAKPNEKALRPSYEEMFDDLSHSKIGLNFSAHGGIGALTNRVTETIASGAVLFSTSEAALSTFLVPNKHYVIFENYSQLEVNISELLSDRDRLERISECAQDFYLKNYTSEHFVQLLINEHIL